MITEDMLLDGDNAVSSLVSNFAGRGGGLILYGAGYCGHEVLSLFSEHNIKVSSVCDDFRAGEYLDGIKITDISSVMPSDVLTIFITSGFNRNMKAKLESLGLMDYYCEIDFGRYEPEKENHEYFAAHLDELNKVYMLMSDDFSRRLLLNLINYRITRNLELLDGMQETTPQYFPESPDLRKYCSSFLDLGAYNGDSIKSYLEYTRGDYSAIYAFEAGKKNYDALMENTSGLHDVHCYNLAVSDRKEILRFNVSDAKNSFEDENGQDELPADSVDNVLKDTKITFIKMDVEGAEYKALKGAEKTIKRCHPVLAVSVYHSVEDLFRLQLLIENICPGVYEYYLRHYSPTVIETILYAVPKLGAG